MGTLNFGSFVGILVNRFNISQKDLCTILIPAAVTDRMLKDEAIASDFEHYVVIDYTSNKMNIIGVGSNSVYSGFVKGTRRIPRAILKYYQGSQVLDIVKENFEQKLDKYIERVVSISAEDSIINDIVNVVESDNHIPVEWKAECRAHAKSDDLSDFLAYVYVFIMQNDRKTSAAKQEESTISIIKDFDNPSALASEYIHGVHDEYIKNGAPICGFRAELDAMFSPDVLFGKIIGRWSDSEDPELFHGFNPVQRISFFGYAATAFFAHQYCVSEQITDKSIHFKRIFESLLVDPHFSLNIVLTLPQTYAADDAKKFKKLGNGDLEDVVFETTFYALINLLKDKASPFYRAMLERRFIIRFSEMAMPYSLMQVQYKESAKALGFSDCVKTDIYSPYITSTKERPSMMVFKNSNPQLYAHFDNVIKAIGTNQQGNYRLDQISQKNTKSYIDAWMQFKNQESLFPDFII